MAKIDAIFLSKSCLYSSPKFEVDCFTSVETFRLKILPLAEEPTTNGEDVNLPTPEAFLKIVLIKVC